MKSLQDQDTQAKSEAAHAATDGRGTKDLERKFSWPSLPWSAAKRKAKDLERKLSLANAARIAAEEKVKDSERKFSAAEAARVAAEGNVRGLEDRFIVAEIQIRAYEDKYVAAEAQLKAREEELNDARSQIREDDKAREQAQRDLNQALGLRTATASDLKDLQERYAEAVRYKRNSKALLEKLVPKLREVERYLTSISSDQPPQSQADSKT